MKSHLTLIGLILLPLFVASQQLYSVDAHKLNFRSGPSTSYATILSLEEGDLVKLISSKDNGWWRVEYNGLRGYVSSKYLRKTLDLSDRFNYNSNLFDQRTKADLDQAIYKSHNFSEYNGSTTYSNTVLPTWNNTSTNDTYKIGGTEYYLNEYYSTTGQPKVKRNLTARKEFLKSKGYDEVPEGYEVDHIKPLSEGGADETWNMQLLTVEEHKRKTASERSRQSNTYNSFSTPLMNLNSYNSNTTFPSTNSSSSSGKVIHTGPRGGQYYINSNGNKTYVKSKN